jgi:hypothetical protein
MVDGGLSGNGKELGGNGKPRKAEGTTLGANGLSRRGNFKNGGFLANEASFGGSAENLPKPGGAPLG